MQNTDKTFFAKDGTMSIYGCIGKHGEVVTATIYSRAKPIISVTGDMHKLAEFDGLVAINTQDELTQLLGIYYHGDIYPLSRKLVCDAIGHLIHLAVGKGRATRKNLYKLKPVSKPGSDVFSVSDGEIDLFKLRMGNVLIHQELEASLLGKDKTYLKIQGRVIIEVLSRPSAKTISYSKKVRLVSKHEHFEPLAKMA